MSLLDLFRGKPFQSTSPVWRTTGERRGKNLERGISIHVPRVEDDAREGYHGLYVEIFQSTSPVWRTTAAIEGRRYIGIISIHVPRVEDDSKKTGADKSEFISIHVPRVEDDYKADNGMFYRDKFQSTSPVWRTTAGCPFNSRFEEISIHVPRVEDD